VTPTARFTARVPPIRARLFVVLGRVSIFDMRLSVLI